MIKKVIAILVLIFMALGVFYWGAKDGGLTAAWIYLDRFGLILGLIAFVPVLFAAWSFIQYTRLKRRELMKIRSEPGFSPAVLVVTIGGMSIGNEVERYLRTFEAFKKFNFDERLFEVHRELEIQADDVDSIIADIEGAQNKIRASAVDKIHLFMKCPMPIAVMLGETLANRIPTIVYHKQQNKGYENWGTLHR